MAEHEGQEALVDDHNKPETPQELTESECKESQHQTQEQTMELEFKNFINTLFSNIRSASEKTTEEEETIKDLPEGSLELKDILSHVNQLIEECGKKSHYVMDPDDYVHLCVLSQNLSSYLTMLEYGQVEKLSRHVATDVAHWLSKLFNYDNALAYIHDHCWEGLVRVCRLALHTKYPKYGTEGFTALYTRPPVVYISGSSPPGFGQYLCSQLGLPQSSLCLVPCNTMFGSSHTMDVASFERLLNDDISCGKTPLLLVAYAGTPLVGHTDNISRLRELCTQNGLWFHLEGDTLATLALPSAPASMSSAATSDSMTLNLRRWFGLPGVPYCTFYRTSDHSLAQAAGLRYSVHTDYSLVLPLWIAMQFIGEQKLKNIISEATNLTQQMCHNLDNIPSIRRLSQPHHVSSVVVFRYCAVSQAELSSDGQEDSDEEQGGSSGLSSPRSPLSPSPDVEDIHPALLDIFNKMIADALGSEIPQVALEVAEVQKQGIFLKFNPLKSARGCKTTSDNIDDFINCLKTQLGILDNTVMGQCTLKAFIEAKDNINLVDLPEFPGVGMIQFIPQSLANADLSKLNTSQKKEIDEMNVTVLEKLSSENSILSKGTTPEGRVCICIGLLPESTNIEELVNEALQYASELENSTKMLEEMNELIMEGIKKAEHDLTEEAGQKLMEEGVLRHVPIVGSLFNWLSPLPDNTGVKGRTFNLRKGHLDTTEKTYKYHMQIEEENGERPAPAPEAEKSTPERLPLPTTPTADSAPTAPSLEQPSEETIPSTEQDETTEAPAETQPAETPPAENPPEMTSKTETESTNTTEEISESVTQENQSTNTASDEDTNTVQPPSVEKESSQEEPAEDDPESTL